MSNAKREELTVYAHLSTYSGYKDSHTFAKRADKITYCNCGSSYDEKDCDLICRAIVYVTWLDKFMPDQTTDFEHTGIAFANNGVCHTYAMREILLCDEEWNTSSARGDDLCVAYYGKYGTGLSYLRTRLIESFEEARKEEELPLNLLNKILDRILIPNSVKYETDAWISTMKNYLGIDVENFYQGEYDRTFLENRIEYLINKRENLFDQCFVESKRTLNNDFKELKKQLYLTEFNVYMHDLARWGYFSVQDADRFVKAFDDAMREHAKRCRRILAELGQ